MKKLDGFVTVVSGLPRSGTSMMMRMLDAGGAAVLADNIRTADEDNPKGYYEFELVKRTRQDASWLENASGKAVKMVYRLLYDLPESYRYRVIFMQRALSEVLASQRKMLKRQGKAGDAAQEVQDELMAALFQRQLAEFATWARAQEHLSLLYVNYNELLEDPRRGLGEIDAFLGGGLDTTAMAQVIDQALYRNRQAKQPPDKGAQLHHG